MVDHRIVHMNDFLAGRFGLVYEGPGNAGYGLGQLTSFLAGRYGAHGIMPREPRDPGSVYSVFKRHIDCFLLLRRRARIHC